ncbi:MAG: glycosyltransferase family 2 protein [Coriobacteriia bacterium]|nr:glycosyltransferase family 2 protein [Coriobacteriia bacterium]
MAPLVNVVIPNWNGLRHLEECLQALRDQTFRDFEVTLVDNGSSDDSVLWVRENHPECRVLELAENRGFAAAVNAGIMTSDTELIALLNNDTRAEPGWLGELVGALSGHSDYDMAASLMLLYYEDEKVNSAGDVYSLWGMTGLNCGFREDAAMYLKPTRVLGACAGAALYRRTLFDGIGLFDEDFFLISEDTDLNLRALIAGKRCLYVPTARILHKLRASIDTAPAETTLRMSERNEMIVFAKDMPWPILCFFPALWIYRQFRRTLPLRPSHWNRIPSLMSQLPRRVAAEREGWRIGWQKRPMVWSRQRAGTCTIIRWLLKGIGKV